MHWFVQPQTSVSPFAQQPVIPTEAELVYSMHVLPELHNTLDATFHQHVNKPGE